MPTGNRLGERPILTDKRLLAIAGKGGVGKSTVAAAVALDAAAHGRRTLVVELAGRSDVARLLGHRGGGAPTETQVEPGLFHVSIERKAVLEDYLEHEVPGPFSAGRLARSRAFSMFVDATPGMGELLAIGKVWELSQRPRRRREARPYDLVVLDAPASGQLLALLKAPRTFGAIARVGPVARQAADIARFLSDPGQTGVIAVTTPEQMAVSEVLALQDGLATLDVALDAAVVNETLSIKFSGDEEAALRAASEALRSASQPPRAASEALRSASQPPRAASEALRSASGPLRSAPGPLRSAPSDPAISSALWLSERARVQRRQLDRLRRELAGIPRARLPFVFEGLDRDGTRQLAEHLVWR